MQTSDDSVIHMTKEIYQQNEHLYDLLAVNIDTHIVKVRYNPTSLSAQEKELV